MSSHAKYFLPFALFQSLTSLAKGEQPQLKIVRTAQALDSKSIFLFFFNVQLGQFGMCVSNMHKLDEIFFSIWNFPCLR